MSATIGYYGGIVTNGLILHLDAGKTDSYVGFGNNWNNIIRGGLSNSGSVASGPTYLKDNGGVFNFNGSSHTITVSHNSELSFTTTSQKTMQAWVNFDTLPTSPNRMIVFGKLSSAFAFDGYWAGLFSNGGVLRCVTNGTAVQRISNSTLTVSTNTWYLYTFISRITSTTNTTKVYINDTEYITTAHGTDGYSESNPFYLGWIGSGVSAPYLNGKIGACYFYTKGLSASEVSQNYDATKTRYGL